MRVLMLLPYPNIQGPLPKILPLLRDALVLSGCAVRTEGWGRHQDHESAWQQIMGRLRDVARVRAAAQAGEFDVLLVETAHDWKTVLRDLAVILATRGRVPRAVLQIHGSLLEHLEAPGHWGFKLATRLLFRNCAAVLVSSSAEARALSRFFPAGRFFVVKNVSQPTGALGPAPAPAEWALPDDLPVVLCVARLMREKGVLDLLEAVPRVLARTRCHFLFAGAGPLEAEVRRCLSQPPWAGHVSWFGYLDKGQLELAYRRASLFVLPTYHAEGFPVVISEALAHGLPIVTTPIRGVADHLVDGVHGRLIAPRQPDQIAQAVLELLANEPLRRDMAQANLAKSREFSLEVVGPEYVGILESLTAGSA